MHRVIINFVRSLKIIAFRDEGERGAVAVTTYDIRLDCNNDDFLNPFYDMYLRE